MEHAAQDGDSIKEGVRHAFGFASAHFSVFVASRLMY
jgi:hypothetical protein